MKFWKKLLVSPTDTLKDTISVLHKGGYRIALVVDKTNKLLGTVTDGDVRRALIGGVSMDDEIKSVMNKQPFTISDDTKKEDALKLMEDKDFLHMPILNRNNILCDLLTLQQLHKKQRYNNPIFIMAGGFGVRLRPLTEEKPKPLLNVGKRPILETIINQFIDIGFHIFYISTHYKSEMIREHFGDGSNLGVSIKYLHEDSPLGTAGSLGLLPDDIPKLPIIMMNGDILTKVDFENLLEFHHAHDGLATMCIREYDFQIPYGVVEIENQNVVKIIEKPTHSFFVNAGIYVLEPSLVSYVDGKSHIDMPDFLKDQIDKGSEVGVFPIHEYWLDIGKIDEYERANKEVSGIF
jgi:dTDP-glucose pyrophosphorylase